MGEKALEVNTLAQERLGACSRSLYREIQLGTLKAFKIERTWYTTEKDWSDFLESKFSK